MKRSFQPPERKRCIKRQRAHIDTMTTYTVKAKVDGTGFSVEITGVGAHHTVLDFPTEAAANAWIAQDRRRTVADDFFRPPAAPGYHGGSDGTEVP